MTESEIKQAAKEALARQTGKSIAEIDDEEAGRVGRKVFYDFP